MTLIAIFDRLLNAPVNRIEFSDGGFVQCPEAMVVDFHDADDAEAWIEASVDGLVLHFNANRISENAQSGLTAQMEPLANIVSVG